MASCTTFHSHNWAVGTPIPCPVAGVSSGQSITVGQNTGSISPPATLPSSSPPPPPPPLNSTQPSLASPSASTHLSGQNVSGSSLPSQDPTNTSRATSISPPVGQTNTSTPSPVPKQSSDVAPGAVAGIAIAMLIVGGLIVGLVLFFLFRRQKKKRNAQQYNQQGGYSGYSTGNEKGPMVVASAVPGSVEDILPQPVEDDAITGQLSKIRDQIKNHIRTHYDFGSANVAIDNSQLAELAHDSGFDTSALSNGLRNPSSGNEFSRLFLAWAVLSKCSGDRRPTLLPAEAIGVTPPLLGKDSRQDALYSKWKAITGHLAQSQRGDVSAFRSQDFDRIIANIDLVLAPFARKNVDDNLRKTNLDMIVKRTASLAFLLFTQPGSFRFDFRSSQGGLVVFPSLLQVTSDQGQLLSPPRQLFEHEVVATQGL